MPPPDAAAHPLIVERSPWLRGRFSVPGDRSISRLALILGAAARGETVIEGLRESPGVLATADMLQLLGARIDRHSGRWHVMGLGSGGFLEPEAALGFGDAATSLQLAIGLVGIYDFPSRFAGGPWLSAQSLQHLQPLLAALGIAVLEGSLDGLPLVLQGPRLPVPPLFEVPDAAPVLKQAMLLAALAIPGLTEITELRPTPDHAERLLRGFGGQVESLTGTDGRYTVAFHGLPALRAQRVAVPGDPTLAAFAVVAALVVPGSELVIEGVSVNPTRSALLATLGAMGADIELRERRVSAGEDVADLHVRHSALAGIEAAAAEAVSTAAEYAALLVAAGFAAGTTRLHGLQQLPAPSRLRLERMAAGLRASGVACRRDADRLEIEGTGRVPGGLQVAVSPDPWSALAFTVLGMAAEQPVTLDDAAALEQWFPGLVAGLEGIGASFAGPRDIFTRIEVSG